MAEKALQIAWISNIIFEPYMQACINGAFMPTGDSVRLNCVMYEENDNSSEILKNADIVVVCLNFEELYPNLIAAVLKSDYKIDQICDDIKKNNLELAHDSVYFFRAMLLHHDSGKKHKKGY